MSSLLELILCYVETRSNTWLNSQNVDQLDERWEALSRAMRLHCAIGVAKGIPGCGFELFDAVVDLTRGVVDLIHCEGAVLLDLLVVELQGLPLALLFDLLVYVPVLGSFLVPLLHEACVAEQLVQRSLS